MTTTGKSRRGSGRPTKDRVLQARIPRHLDEELREHAHQLGLSVSTVVRNVLLNTFQLVEGVVTDSGRLVRAAQGRSTPAPTAPEVVDGPVVGWQEVILNMNGICDDCNDILRRGERAAIGVPPGPRPVLLCGSCLQRLTAVPTAGKKK